MHYTMTPKIEFTLGDIGALIAAGGGDDTLVLASKDANALQESLADLSPGDTINISCTFTFNAMHVRDYIAKQQVSL